MTTVAATQDMGSAHAKKVFDELKKAFGDEPVIGREKRQKALRAVASVLADHEDEICRAICADFGHRSFHETRMLEIAPALLGIRYTLKHMRSWMKPRRRKVSLLFFGGTNRVIPRAKGVVGIISPWNYPLFLALGPLTSAVAAGNRVMIKSASNSQHLARLLARLFQGVVPKDVVRILPGVPADSFSALPFDHLVFTGSTSVGRTVMRRAADHLTPVTLELGGKSPTILAPDFDPVTALKRILYAKLINAGQTCVAPDYLFVPEDRMDAVVKTAMEIARQRYPDPGSPDYTAIIHARAYDRLKAVLSDASAKGAKAVQLLDRAAFDDETRKLSPVILTGVTGEMRVMKEEIFGPILPVLPYRNMDDVLSYINARQRPLALYLFSNDRKLQQHVLDHTLSGGVTVNDCLMHLAQHDMPFGGVGESGMGHYHAREGFLEMSKLRPVFTQSRLAVSLAPPYGKTVDRLFDLIRKNRWVS